MAILAGDLKLVASQNMDDVPEGGGAPTGVVVGDGVSNAIFPDISELDRAGGRVNLRKVHVHVQTDDRDTFLGSNIIVAEPPADPRVSITLFTNGSTFDRRTEASSRVESYLNKGPQWPGILYENHIAGQRSIQILQELTTELPTVGKTFVLVQNETLSNEFFQYVRATTISAVVRTFYDENGNEFRKAVVTLGISDALRYDFRGSSVTKQLSKASGACWVRDTVVADAGTYVGVTPLVDEAVVGDFSVKGTSIYTQLVPSAQTETPISFVPPYATAGLPAPGADPVSYTAGHAWTPSINFDLPGGCLPGSLSIVTSGITIFDDAGLLKTTAGNLGTIDYANGILTLNSGAMSGSKVVTYTPAAQILRAPQSTEIPVTQESRSQSYVGTVYPTPQPGTLSINYKVQNRWYVLSDSGNGLLLGLDSSYGAGTFSPSTGAFSVTLGALPDVGSSIVLTWNVPTQETQQPSTVLVASQEITLSPPSGKSVQVGSLTVDWVGGKTASVNTAGVLSGDATGLLTIAQDKLDFAPDVLPPVGTELTIEYVAGPKQLDSFDHPSRAIGGQVPVTASLGSIEPGSLEIEWNTLTDTTTLGTYTAAQILEMGLASGVDPTQFARDDGVGYVVRNGMAIGTVDYDTGEISFNPDVLLSIPRPVYVAARAGIRFRLNYAAMEYVTAPSLYPNDASGYVKLRYNSAGSTSSHSETVTFAPDLRLVPGVNAQVVPGSVLLTVSGAQPWGDDAQGNLREFTTSGWVTRGTLNYLTGSASLTSWTTGVANALTRASCVTTVGENISSEYVFRTAASPLRPGSLSIQYARAVGGTQSVTADLDGVISGTGVFGTVDYENGLVRVRFGTVVTAAGNESEPWYHAGNVVSGQIFKPEPVAASTVRYSAVAYSYLPMDAALLGIDPVRLPSDGRVPIFRAGGFAVVGNTASVTATVSNAQVIDCARVRLSRVRVIGHDDVVINTGYTADLEAGTVTFDDVAGYSQPVTVEHRIEDMAVIRDVQIDGTVTFTRALTHDYPEGSFLSSALVPGDLKSRVSIFFDQATWNGTSWLDALSGSAATGTYNDVLAPLVVTNRGALTERWALVFTSTQAFNIVGEHVGVIGTGTINAECSPINPATSTPYFTIEADGWGGGWSIGNILRFNTVGAMTPVWVVRTVQQGPNTGIEHSFTLLSRGDVDRP